MEIVRNGMEMFEIQNKEEFKALLKRCIEKKVLTEMHGFDLWRESVDGGMGG